MIKTYYSVSMGTSEFDEHIESFRWTTDPPTKEGWYWVRRKGEESEIEVVFIDGWGDGVFTVRATGSEISTSPNYFSHWLGPLPEPGLPK